MTVFASGGNAAGSAGGSSIMLIVMVAMIAVLYFVMIRPQRKQEQAMNAMKNSLEVGDEITTIGGIIGEVISIKGETVVIESGHNKTRIRILRDAIKTIDVKANGEVPDFSGKKSRKIKEKAEKIVDKIDNKEENTESENSDEENTEK